MVWFTCCTAAVTGSMVDPIQLGDLLYREDDGNITITDFTGSGIAAIIPAKIDGKPVTDIQAFHFIGFHGLAAPCWGLKTIQVDPDNTHFSSLDGVLFNKDQSTLIRYPMGKQGTYTIPAGVTNLDYSAFVGCVGLTSVMISSDLSGIHGEPFPMCSSLESIEADVNNAHYSSLDGVLFDKNQSTLIQYPTGKKGGYRIPSTVTHIGEGSFASCRKLSSVDIPPGVTIIESGAFAGCLGLTDIVIPSTVKRIESDAFAGCSALMSITIPPSVTSIGGSAFEGCSSLESVVIPSNVSTIEGNTFNGCGSLISIEIPSSVTSIEESAFKGCDSLTRIEVDSGNTQYSSLDGVLFNKDQSILIYCPKGKSGSYTVPSSVISIRDQAFSGCKHLTSIKVPHGLKNIGGWAFEGCSGLTSFTIPPGVTCIEGGVFQKCSSLSHVEIPNSVTSIGYFAFYDCSSLSSILIPEGLTSIEEGAFNRCRGLESVNIPPSVTNIGRLAFLGCKGLTEMVIPSSVTTIGDYPFEGCDSLERIKVDSNNPHYSSLDDVLFNKDKSILICCPAKKNGIYTIPSGVTTIEDLAFGGCVLLTSIILPDNLTRIGSVALGGCIGLTNMEIPQTVTEIGQIAFSGCGSLNHIEVNPNNAYYSSLDGVLVDKDQSMLICFPSGKGGAYSIPTGVSDIDSAAFRDCVGLTEVVISAGITEIKNTEFSGCSSLTQIEVDPNNPRYSSLDGVLFNKDQSTLIYCPAKMNGTYAIPQSVTSIESSAFSECSKLTTVIIPAGLKGIDGWSFPNCDSLEVIEVNPDSPNFSSLDGVLFDKNKSTLISYPPGKQGAYTIPSGVTIVGEWSFSNCSGLTEITIPCSVVAIGDQAFEYCEKLTIANFMGDAPFTGEKIFDSTGPEFTACYFEGAIGFSGSEWKGYPLVKRIRDTASTAPRHME